MFEWVMTEAEYIRPLGSTMGEYHAVFETTDHSKAVVVRYAGDTDIMFFNEEMYVTGEVAAECLVTWMHAASTSVTPGSTIELPEHDWDAEFDPLCFIRVGATLQANRGVT